MRLLLVLLLSCGLAGSQPMNKCRLQGLMIQATEGKSNGLSDRTFMAKGEAQLFSIPHLDGRCTKTHHCSLDSLHPVACAVETVTQFNTSAVTQMSRETGERVRRFYGLFQLLNGLTCRDDTARGPNICGANCSGESGSPHTPCSSQRLSGSTQNQSGFLFPLFVDQRFLFFVVSIRIRWVRERMLKLWFQPGSSWKTRKR